jgi:hypothetical protein
MEKDVIPKEQIEQRAYELYLGCGCDGGHDLEHWLAAEEELRQERSSLRESMAKKSRGAAAGFQSEDRTRPYQNQNLHE